MKILDHVPKFHAKIYSLLKKVPKGKVTTYKALAEAAGTKAYRAVGQAMKCNPYAPIVPCHRVVAADGSIGGFQGTKNTGSKEIRKKISMLKKERIKIKNNRIVDFEKILFGF
ncbi:MGMT family protein [Candidatus Woesearchaeota archaeon]|nr:MGMT family protein [Candidatus Woesearchaeota archaeon]